MDYASVPTQQQTNLHASQTSQFVATCLSATLPNNNDSGGVSSVVPPYYATSPIDLGGSPSGASPSYCYSQQQIQHPGLQSQQLLWQSANGFQQFENQNPILPQHFVQNPQLFYHSQHLNHCGIEVKFLIFFLQFCSFLMFRKNLIFKLRISEFFLVLILTIVF